MKPEIRIFENMESLSRAAAKIFVEQAAWSARQRGRFLVALHGGSTPGRLFELLAAEFGDQVPWQNVHVFWGDERCVPPDDPGSNFGQARGSLLRQVPIPESNVHRVRGELGPADAATDYIRVLQDHASPPLRWPAFDLVYLGMGDDGHTASLFPGSTVNPPEPAVPVTAEYQDRPANRVSLTPRVLNSARMVVFMAAGRNKARTLSEVLEGRYNPAQYPAQRIAPRNGRLIWLLDDTAASELSENRFEAGEQG